jgi:hypothetical protein
MSVKITDRDHGFRQLMINARKMSRTQYVRVGVSDTPHDGSPGMSIAAIGAIHEFGIGVPQRSFLRGWVDENQKGWVAKLRETVYRALTGREAWMKNFGEYAVEGVRARMRLGIGPPLLEATVKRKQNGSTPLIESEQLINGVEYDVGSDA